MSLLALSTVGFGEVHPLSESGRLFTSILIIYNLGGMAYTLAVLSAYFFDSDYQLYLKIKKMNKQIALLKAHTIVCGYGRNGRQACALLQAHKIDFVVVEQNKELIEELRTNSILYIEGSAVVDEYLAAANVAQASNLITTLPDDADNLFVVVSAHDINNGLKIISRASAESSVRKLKAAGATHVILPDRVGGSHMASLLIKPNVLEFMDYMIMHEQDAGIEEMLIEKGSILAGKTVLELKELYEVNTIGLKRADGTYTINPSHNLMVDVGHNLIVLGLNKNISQMKG
jgi:voltage-gated potassium channel